MGAIDFKDTAYFQWDAKCITPLYNLSGSCVLDRTAPKVVTCEQFC